MEKHADESGKYNIEIGQGKAIAIGDFEIVNVFQGQPKAIEQLIALIERIEGQQQEIRHLLSVIAQSSGDHRGVNISGDVSRSIIVTGDGNQIQISDRGRLAHWWQEIGLDPSAYLPQVAAVFAPLYFPLAHLSKAIPLDEVYVDLPIVKPPTEEALLRPLRPGQRMSGETLRQADGLLQRNDRAALVGVMGAGKTTTLHYLTWVYAQRPENRVYWQGDTLVPFYARLPDLAEFWDRTKRDDAQQFIQELARAVSIALAGTFPAASVARVLQQVLQNGNALILLDALDEFRASDQERLEFVRSLQTLFNASPLFNNNHVLMTSRPYKFLNPMGFEQYAVQDLQSPDQLVFRLGQAILRRKQPNLSEDQIESWLEQINQTISSPRMREFSSPLYLTLMVSLGTSQETSEEGIALLKGIERPSDPYRYFLLRTVDWEKLKGNEPTVESEKALLVLGYAGYYTFTERSANLSERIAADLPMQEEQIATVLEFWKKTGLLWEDTLRSELVFRHSGFQAFGVALALRDMILRHKTDKVNEIWERHRWDASWRTPLQLFESLGGGEQE